MKSNYDILGNHIRLIDTRNRESITDRVLGINIDKFFMPSVANVIGTDLSKYKLITKGKFACNPMHVGRDERLPVALYDEEEPAIVSPAYFMFEVIDNSILNEDYLMMWFRRPEFDRICWLHTDGSVRGGITWDDICRLELPIPPIESQLEIVNSYKAITERIALKQKINDNLLASMEAILDNLYSDTFGDIKLSEMEKSLAPKGWEVFQLSELADCQSGYAFYKDGYDDNGTRIVDLGNINRNAEFVEAKSDKYIAPERILDKKYDKFRLLKNDLVMVMTDRKSTMELLGKTARIFIDEPLMLNQRVYRIRSTEYCSYLYVYLNSERVHNFHKSRALGTAQKYVNNGDINIIPIVVPPKQQYLKLKDFFDKSWLVMEENLLEMKSLYNLQEQLTFMLSSR